MLEAIIASGIIITAVSSALTLVQGSISAEKESETSIVGSNLAREGIEVVRSLRDGNWLSGAPFDEGLTGASFDYTGILVFDPSANAWSVDFGPDDLTESATRVFRYVSGGGGAEVGLFVQAATQPASTVATPFRRLVTVDAVCSDGGAGYTIQNSGAGCGAQPKIGLRVRSTVQWTVSDRARTDTAETLMFDWR